VGVQLGSGYEQLQHVEAAAAEVKHPAVRAVLAAFPNAEITRIRETEK